MQTSRHRVETGLLNKFSSEAKAEEDRKTMVSKRIKQLESVKKTHNEPKKQGASQDYNG